MLQRRLMVTGCSIPALLLMACGEPVIVEENESPADSQDSLSPTEQITSLTVPAAPYLCGTGFVIDDRRVTDPNDSRISVNDHEVDPVHLRLTFLNEGAGTADGKVIVVSVNPEDGTLMPDTVQVIGANSTGVCPGLPFGNGPEWARSTTRGIEVYFHQKDANGVPFLARATQRPGRDGGFDRGADWDVNPVPQSEYRSCVLPSFNENDPYPLLPYVKMEPGNTPEGVWRIDTDNFVETATPGIGFSTITGGSPFRLIPGRQQGVIAVKDAAGQVQMARADLLTGVITNITSYIPCSASDPTCTPVNLNSVNVVRAPKLGPDALVFYTIVNNSYFDVYLSVTEGQVQYLGKVRPPVPPTGTNPFVLNEENILDKTGEPFIIVNMASNKTNPPKSSEIWLASPFATSNCNYRKVSGAGNYARSDLDSLTIPGKTTYVYYHEVMPLTGRSVMHRTATGL